MRIDAVGPTDAGADAERCVAAVAHADAVGATYIEAAAKKAAADSVFKMRSAFRRRLFLLRSFGKESNQAVSMGGRAMSVSCEPDLYGAYDD